MAYLYQPSKWGQEYHDLTQDEALGAGAAGPGKTEVLLWEPLAQIVSEEDRQANKRHLHPVARGNSAGWALHLRRTLPMLEQTIVRSRKVFNRLDPGAKFNEQTHTWLFSSGYRYQFGHCKDPSDWEQYFSSQYSMILFDELVQFTEEQYEQISGRLRSTDPVLSKMLKVRSMSNPFMSREGMDGVSTGVDPLWVRKRFVDQDPGGRVTRYKTFKLYSGEETRISRIYLPAKLSDNPNPEYVRQYETRLRGMKPHMQKALLEGDWYSVFGSFYGDDWDNSLHVCKPFKIPDYWSRFRSMDWGFKAPGCIHWWAMDPDGNMFCEREFYFKLLTGRQVAKRVRDMETAMGLWYGDGSRITGPADNQLWEARGSSAVSIAAEMAKEGVNWVKADKTSRERNAGLFLGRLQDHNNRTSQPGVVFFDTCKQAIRTIPSILADPGSPEVPQDGGDDHAHDSVLYASAFASHGRAGIPSKKSKRRADYEERPSDRGQYGYGDSGY